MSRARRHRRLLLLLVAGVLQSGCEQPDMADQPRLDTYETTPVFPDGTAAQPVPEGTVHRDQRLRPVPRRNPLPITHQTLDHGRDQYRIFCAPCHGANGYGRGVIVQRGFPAPPTYHSERLRQAPDLHFYDVITNGYGAMYPYASRVPPDDRWAIIAYIRSLQLSQHARPDDLPAGRSLPGATDNGDSGEAP